MHFASMIKLFGPVYAWWLFAFERFNGMLEKVNNNGLDGGRIELTLMRNWVQTHLIYEFLLAMPADASNRECRLIDKLIKTEGAKERGAMMTEIAIFRSKASVDSVSLPKAILKPVNLHKLSPAGLDDNETNVYTLSLEHCQQVWPDLHLQRELSDQPGTAFLGHQVARRLMYIRKDGLRYGSVANTKSSVDSFAFVRKGDQRVPTRIEELFAVQIPGSNKPPHVCAIVRKLFSDDQVPIMPWDLLYVLSRCRTLSWLAHHQFPVHPSLEYRSLTPTASTHPRSFLFLQSTVLWGSFQRRY
jgi:hypothetical protein